MRLRASSLSLASAEFATLDLSDQLSLNVFVSDASCGRSGELCVALAPIASASCQFF